MKTDDSIASFWHSNTAADKVPKLLTGKRAPLAFDPLEAAGSADETSGDSMLEGVE